MKVNRRDFLATTAAGIAAAAHTRAAAPLIPQRTLGKTGARVSTLAFGGGSRFLRYEDEEVALEILNHAIDEGITYLDTAQSYGDGRSETRYGRVLKHRREEVFLATKTSERNYDEGMRSIEASLRRLQTDRVDLLHIHSLGQMEDLEKIEASEGILKALYRAREEGMTRFIGMTSHTDAATMKMVIERHDLDCVQMALNPATKTAFATGFEELALPAANRKNLGVIAMKITGQEALVGSQKGQTNMQDLLHYSMSLQVAACVVGMPRPEHLEENISLARSFVALSDSEKHRIRQAVKPSIAAFNHFMAHHQDCGLKA